MRPLLPSIITLVLASPIHADLFRGQVVSITDDDTITMLVDRQQHKIRLAGIDAPEKAQPFGSRSTENLGRLTFQKEATADCPKQDRWGRFVCNVFVGGQDVGLQQVADGLAWWYRRYSGEQPPADREAYGKTEEKAKAAQIGLWAESGPVPPWEWRLRSKHLDAAAKPHALLGCCAIQTIATDQACQAV